MSVLVVVGAVVLAVAFWALRLCWFPYGPCRACQGRRGRGMGSTARAYSRCHWCGGKGERLRTGAKMWPRNREK